IRGNADRGRLADFRVHPGWNLRRNDRIAGSSIFHRLPVLSRIQVETTRAAPPFQEFRGCRLRAPAAAQDRKTRGRSRDVPSSREGGSPIGWSHHSGQRGTLGNRKLTTKHTKELPLCTLVVKSLYRTRKGADLQLFGSTSSSMPPLTRAQHFASGPRRPNSIKTGRRSERSPTTRRTGKGST